MKSFKQFLLETSDDRPLFPKQRPSQISNSDPLIEKSINKAKILYDLIEPLGNTWEMLKKLQDQEKIITYFNIVNSTITDAIGRLNTQLGIAEAERQEIDLAPVDRLAVKMFYKGDKLAQSEEELLNNFLKNTQDFFQSGNLEKSPNQWKKEIRKQISKSINNLQLKEEIRDVRNALVKYKMSHEFETLITMIEEIKKKRSIYQDQAWTLYQTYRGKWMETILGTGREDPDSLYSHFRNLGYQIDFSSYTPQEDEKFVRMDNLFSNDWVRKYNSNRSLKNEGLIPTYLAIKESIETMVKNADQIGLPDLKMPSRPKR